ncbi:MAG TPA: isoprenyl transferase [Anaerolineaceae bacterium]|nr:isoprenyl transferase [Anaerolineaceae bacterium]HPN53440.1 isoprenyl transferase [Anaerolineaceae bacterium]
MSPEQKAEEFKKKPTHIAVIMDGNGRWAAKRGLPRLAGHQAGTENLRRIITACVEFGIPYLTIYAFSTENWRRPQDEVQGLMHILETVLERELAELHKQGVQLRHIGHLEGLPGNLQEKVRKAVELTRDNTRLTLCVAFNYGGRDEIVCALRQMAAEGLKPEEITEESISAHLFTAGIPDPDLIIRTSGELRTSNFLIWQAAYAEYYPTPLFWPDFDKEALREAILAYGKRERRFGRVSAQES